MNSIKEHPLATEFSKTKISKELELEFFQFLSRYPEHAEQALYLFQTKKEPLEKIINDLFDVPIKDQINWTKKTNAKSSSNSNASTGVSNLESGSADTDVPHRLIFKEWKQEHGFDSPSLEVGDTHTIIKFEPYHTTTIETKYRWDFYRARYGKRGWGNRKTIKSISRYLLDNNSNPGWIAKSWLEENYFLTDILHKKTSNNNIPNPLLLDANDTHTFLCLLLGHPYLHFSDNKHPLENVFGQVNTIFYRHEIGDVFLLSAFFQYQDKKGNKTIIKGRDVAKEGTLLPGSPISLIYNNKYSKLACNSLPLKLLQNALYGISIPKKEWNDFIGIFEKHYPKQKVIEYKDSEDNSIYMPNYVPIKAKHWKSWIDYPESFKFKNYSVFKKPIIRLDPSSYSHKSNKISFQVENFTPQIIEYLEKLPDNKKLFEMLQVGLYLGQTKNTENISFYTPERHEISQFLQLLENYEFCYNEKEKNLMANQRLHYSLNFKKHPTLYNSYVLHGSITESEDKNALEISTGSARVLGLSPAYMLYKNQIYRVGDMLSARLINDSLLGIVLDKNEVKNFYTTTLSFLRQREVSLCDSEGLIRVSALYNYTLKGHMTIWEEDGVLTSRLTCSMETAIGRYKYPFGINREDFIHKLDGKHYQISRSKPKEESLLNEIYYHGWVDQGGGTYSMNESDAKNFVLEILPKQTKTELIRYYGQKKLKRWKVKSWMPFVSTSIKSHINWFDVSIEIKHEEAPIDMLRIIELWRNGSRSIELEDGSGIALIDQEWLEKNGPILAKLVESNSRLSTADNIKDQNLKVENFQIGLLNEITEASQKIDYDKTWKNLIDKIKNINHLEMRLIPETVKTNLRDYQKIGVTWLCLLKELGFCGILSDDMGLGKTLQALAYLAIERQNKASCLPVLVVAPTSVVFNWKKEIEHFIPHFKTVILQGPNRSQVLKNINNCDIAIISYNIVQHDIDALSNIKFSTIILDEAQMIKNVRSKNAQAVFRLKADYRISLTGTPIENSVAELWSQFNFLMPGLMGSQKDFCKSFNSSNKHGASENGDLDMLCRQTKPFILRRMKHSVITELPPKTEQVMFCEMLGAQKKLYNTVLDVIRNDIADKIKKVGYIQKNRVAIFDGMLKLRQICCDPRLSSLAPINPPESAKMHLFLDIISEIVGEGHRVLVFSQFVKMLGLIHQPLKDRKIKFLQLDGSTNNRQQLVNNFQESNEFPVFLISLRAGGTGINLTSADYVIHYDPWWNHAVEAQATDRVHRIGQKHQVHVYKLIASNSIEEKIQNLQSKKKNISNRIIQAAESIEDIFNVDDLAEVFDL